MIAIIVATIDAIIMKKNFVRKISKRNKYTYNITIPKELIDQFNWRERQRLKLISHPRKKSIEIKDWKKK